MAWRVDALLIGEGAPLKHLLVEKGSTIEIPPQSAGLFLLAAFKDDQTFPFRH